MRGIVKNCQGGRDLPGVVGTKRRLCREWSVGLRRGIICALTMTMCVRFIHVVRRRRTCIARERTLPFVAFGVSQRITAEYAGEALLGLESRHCVCSAGLRCACVVSNVFHHSTRSRFQGVSLFQLVCRGRQHARYCVLCLNE